MVESPKKILVIRFSSIGDIVLTSALVRCIRQQLPGAEVHFLTKKQFAPVIQANPNVDTLWLYDHNFGELIPQLKSQGFDFIIDLHKNYRSSIVKSRLGIRSASFPKLNFKKWLAVNVKLNLLPDIHIVDRYFKAALQLGVKYDGHGLDYYIPAADEVLTGTLPATHHRGFVAIVIGGKHNTKILPAGKVIEVCQKLAHPVILLGGKEDRDHGEQIGSAVGNLVYNGCGLYNINQSASLIRQSFAVLSNDTGLMHVAAAFKKPVVSVWGNTIPAFGMTPFLPEEFKSNSLIAEVKGLSCRPCSKLGHKKCPKKHFRCMNEIVLPEIIAFLNGKSENSKS